MISMNPRHAAALALVGWYLITPPDCNRPTDRLNCQSHFSLGSWQIVDVFDTAADCKAAQEQKSERASDEWNGYHGKTDTKAFAKIARDVSEADHALCIASDDPRLK